MVYERSRKQFKLMDMQSLVTVLSQLNKGICTRACLPFLEWTIDKIGITFSELHFFAVFLRQERRLRKRWHTGTLFSVCRVSRSGEAEAWWTKLARSLAKLPSPWSRCSSEGLFTWNSSPWFNCAHLYGSVCEMTRRFAGADWPLGIRLLPEAKSLHTQQQN